MCLENLDPFTKTVVIVAGAVIILSAGFGIYKLFRKVFSGFVSFELTKHGIKIKPTDFKKIKPEQVSAVIKDIVYYIESEKCRLMDDIYGIKKRCFNQSIYYTRSKLYYIRERFVKEYRENREDENREELLTLEAFLEKDFGDILVELEKIIEDNHLINRQDREYEEEIKSKALQLTEVLSNKVKAYPIAAWKKSTEQNTSSQETRETVSEALRLELTVAIEDSLRRSRTLSMQKRQDIEEKKKEYQEKRSEQLKRILVIFNAEEIDKITSDLNKL